MNDADPDRMLTVDEAYRAAYRFIAQYYSRVPAETLFLMLRSMGVVGDRETNDPAARDDWMSAVDDDAVATTELPEPPPPEA